MVNTPVGYSRYPRGTGIGGFYRTKAFKRRRPYMKGNKFMASSRSSGTKYEMLHKRYKAVKAMMKRGSRKKTLRGLRGAAVRQRNTRKRFLSGAYQRRR